MSYSAFTATIDFGQTRGAFLDAADEFHAAVERLVAFQPTQKTSVAELGQYESDLRRAVDIARKVPVQARTKDCIDASSRFTEAKLLQWEERLFQVKALNSTFDGLVSLSTKSGTSVAPAAASNDASIPKSVTSGLAKDATHSRKRRHSDSDEDPGSQSALKRRAPLNRTTREPRKSTQPAPCASADVRADPDPDQDPSLPKLTRSNRTYAGIPTANLDALPTGTGNPNVSKIDAAAAQLAIVPVERSSYSPARVGDKKWLDVARCTECVATGVAICVGPGCASCYMCSLRKLSCSHTAKHPCRGRKAAKTIPDLESASKGRKRDAPSKDSEVQLANIPTPLDGPPPSEAELLNRLVQIQRATTNAEERMKQESNLHKARLNNRIAMANAEYEEAISGLAATHGYLIEQNKITISKLLSELSAKMT